MPSTLYFTHSISNTKNTVGVKVKCNRNELTDVTLCSTLIFSNGVGLYQQDACSYCHYYHYDVQTSMAAYWLMSVLVRTCVHLGVTQFKPNSTFSNLTQQNPTLLTFIVPEAPSTREANAHGANSVIQSQMSSDDFSLGHGSVSTVYC